MALRSRYNANSTGDVTYGNKVLLSIISFAVREISGVTSLAGKGARADVFGGKTANIDIFINVDAKVCCTDVAFRVQENVKSAVETMTEFKTGVINVNIMGLSFDVADEHIILS
ncbi:MAG: Asp23/Gls24 family envelope stress response protein [Firmicutes bacterium]|nr:Asp23/Gls24 family envelope stress response protein [Bacillota bacterium]